MSERLKKTIVRLTLLCYLWAFGGPLELQRSAGFFPLGGVTAAVAMPPPDVLLQPGMNLVATPGTVPAGAASCFVLLGFAGGEGVIDRIEQIDPATQDIRACSYSAGAPAGVDFPVLSGQAYLIHAKTAATIGFGGEFACPALDLVPGVNLIGVPSPESGLGCQGLMSKLGQGTVATVQRFDPEKGSYQSCVLDTGSGASAGTDFPIVPGEGYLMHMASAAPGFNPNNLNDPERCAH
jgi:hypothetical protein